MALPLGTALLYAVVPALAGAGIGFFLLRPARQAASEAPAAKGLALVVHAMLGTAPLLAFAGALLASTPPAEGAPAPPDATAWLLALGAAGVLSGIAQGVLGGRGFPAVAKDPAGFGRLLIRLVLPEMLVVVAFVALLLRVA